MINLRRMSTHNGVQHLQQSAARYRHIGIILLNDRNGKIVDGIEKSVRGDPVAAVDMIYTTSSSSGHDLYYLKQQWT